jgi:hypothetical protein
MFLKRIDLIPIDPKKLADWNGGYRAGFREELSRIHHSTKEKLGRPSCLPVSIRRNICDEVRCCGSFVAF